MLRDLLEDMAAIVSLALFLASLLVGSAIVYDASRSAPSYPYSLARTSR